MGEENRNDIEAAAHEPPPEPHPDPDRSPLYGGVSGLALAIPEFRICHGLMLRDTYAHVMAPYLLAFARPKRPHAHHPPPWKAAEGGLGFDVLVEMALGEAVRPTGLDRLNTLWWVLALLRMATAAPLRLPVVSDVPFAAVATSGREPTLWTIEMPPRQLRVARQMPQEITVAHLEWVRDVFLDGARLMDDDRFNRAFQTFDQAIWAHSTGSAIIMAWASLETLFRPGPRDITKTLAKYLATFLYAPGPERDRAYQRIERLYEARGSAAHDAQFPERDQLLDSFDLARRALAKCLETRRLPEPDALLAAWKSGA